MPAPSESQIGMHYCRRCGDAFTHKDKNAYTCPKSHTIYANASPAATTIILNSNNEVLVVRRGLDPGKGQLHLPGGFCNGDEPLEDAARREIQEEVGIRPSQYGPISFICSGLDPYEFAGETLPVLVGIFIVKLKIHVNPESHDDVADSFFVPLEDIKPEDFFFPAVQKGLRQFKDNFNGKI